MWTRRAVAAAVLLAAVVLAAAAVSAQSRHPVSGRVIAQVMGYEGAAWLERPERESEEQPAKAIAALGITAGQVVAAADRIPAHPRPVRSHQWSRGWRRSRRMSSHATPRTGLS